MWLHDHLSGSLSALKRPREWVKRPLASLQFTVCERKVIRAIVTSTMTKLGQCNPPTPPPSTTGKAEKGKKEGEGWGCRHQTVCKDISMGTLERGLLSLRVGICIVLEQDEPRWLWRAPSFPVVCDRWCLAVNRPPYFFSNPLLLLFFPLSLVFSFCFQNI